MNTKLLYLLISSIFSSGLAAQSSRVNRAKSNQDDDGFFLNIQFIEAAKRGSTELMIDLLKRGADVNVCRYSNTKKTALHKTAKKGHFDCLKALLEAKADVNVCDIGDQTALHLAAKNGHLDCVKALIEAEADVNACDFSRKSALHVAASFGRLACVKALIEGKSDVNAHDSDGYTALHWVAERGHFGCLKALIEAKADVNARNDKRETALHVVSFFGDRLACVEALAEAKSDVNARDNKGVTALHRAVQMGHLAYVEALVKAKADVNARDNEGKTAFYYAANKGHHDCLKALVKYSYTLSPAKEAVCESRKRIFSVLLLFGRLRKPHKEGGLLFKDLGNTSLQFEILSKSKLLQNDLIVIFLDELKKGREIKPGLLTRSKEAVVEFLRKKVTEIVSTMKVTSLKDEMRDLLSDVKLEELIKEGLDERLNQLKVKKRQMNDDYIA